MYVPNLVKIHWHLLKLYSGYCQEMNGHKDDQRKTIISHLYHVAGYKNHTDSLWKTRNVNKQCLLETLQLRNQNIMDRQV